MAKKPAKPAKVPALPRQAEERIRATKCDIDAMSTKEVQRLVQELQIHQLELEMQNEELRRTQTELEVARDRYADLYDFSPVGHLTLDVQGHILEANIMAGTLLGLSQNKLSGLPLARFIAGEDKDTLHHHIRNVLEGAAPVLCELKLRRESGVSCSVLLKSLAVPEESGRIIGWRTAIIDIRERKQAEADLKRMNAELVAAKERWDWVLRATHDGIWDWDLAHDQVYFSSRWKQMHGFDEQDKLESSKEWSERIHPEDRAHVLEQVEAYLKRQRSQFWEEYRIQRKDGSWMWVLDRGVAIFDEQGRAVRMVGAETDITWRKETEEATRRKEQEFHALADNVPAFFSYVDRDRRYRFVNNQYEQLFQRSADRIVGLTMQELLGPEGYAVVQPHLDESFGGREVSFEYRMSVPNLPEIWLSARYMPDRDRQGYVVGLFLLLVDVTQLKRTEVELREKEQRLRQLSVRLLQSQEEERKRVAQELHDDFTQRLASLAIDLRMAQRDVPGIEPLRLTRLQQLGDLAERLATDLQQVAHRLHPSLLEHVGLEAAVREQVEEFAHRTGLKAEIIVRRLPPAMPPEQALCLYRVLQESLRNVQKHAGATNVLVRFLGTGKGVGLCVHDDGRGIENLESSPLQKGLGLISMEERVGTLGGEFRIRTKPGDGTEIHAWVPLEDVKSES